MDTFSFEMDFYDTEYNGQFLTTDGFGITDHQMVVEDGVAILTSPTEPHFMTPSDYFILEDTRERNTVSEHIEDCSVTIYRIRGNNRYFLRMKDSPSPVMSQDTFIYDPEAGRLYDCNNTAHSSDEPEGVLTPDVEYDETYSAISLVGVDSDFSMMLPAKQLNEKVESCELHRVVEIESDFDASSRLW